MVAIAAVVEAIRKYAPVDKPFEYALGIVVIVVVLRLELGRNAGNHPQRRSDARPCARFGKFLKQYAPEALSLLTCAVVAFVLRIRAGSLDLVADVPGHIQGSSGLDGGSVDKIAEDVRQALLLENATAEIAQQWPILLGADTLLALQAMLRVLVLVSSTVREGSGPTLIKEEAAAISLGAAHARLLLVAKSSVYMLDGPLGGNLPVICEVISFGLLVILCRGVSKRAWMTSALTLGAACWVASRNYLNMGEEGHVPDALFIFAHLSELLAAFAYLSHALVLDFDLENMSQGGVALGFAHIIMPIQACFAAYYFVQAFDEVPGLTGAGHPFQILQWGCIAQVGAYAGAALLHCAEYLESSPQEPPRRAQEPSNAQPLVRAEPIEQSGSANEVPRHIAVPAVL